MRGLLCQYNMFGLVQQLSLCSYLLLSYGLSRYCTATSDLRCALASHRKSTAGASQELASFALLALARFTRFFRARFAGHLPLAQALQPYSLISGWHERSQPVVP